MKRTLMAWVFLALLGTAQTRDPEKGKKVLEQAIQALGGPAYLNARDFRSEGRAFQFTRFEELSGMARIVNYERQPDKFRQEVGKKADVVFVLNGEQGWDANFRGVADIPPEEIERIRLGRMLSVDYVLRFRFNKEPGLEVAHIGTDLVDGRTVDLVEVADTENRVVTLAIDQNSHLPLRREWVRRNPKTRDREENVETLGKYVAAKGAPKIMVPLYIRRERNGIKIFESFLTEVHAGSRLAATLFERPPGPARPDPRRKQ